MKKIKRQIRLNLWMITALIGLWLLLCICRTSLQIIRDKQTIEQCH